MCELVFSQRFVSGKIDTDGGSDGSDLENVPLNSSFLDPSAVRALGEAELIDKLTLDVARLTNRDAQVRDRCVHQMSAQPPASGGGGNEKSSSLPF